MRGFASAVVMASALLLAGSSSQICAQEGSPFSRAEPANWTIPSNEAIQRLLADRLGKSSVGTVVGVMEPSGRRVVVFGRSGAANGRPLDGDTVFQLGSLSKQFVGLLLADM